MFYGIFIPLYCSQSVYRSCSGKACELCFDLGYLSDLELNTGHEDPKGE
jgi:hypothetical protein